MKQDYGYNIVRPEDAAREIARKTMYVDGKCAECGSTVHGPQRGQHSNFHANYIHRSEVKEGFLVSAVKWCDMGDHPYKAGAPGSQSIDVMQRDDEGQEVRVTMDICGEHAFPTGIPTSPLKAVEREYEKARMALPSAYPAHNED